MITVPVALIVYPLITVFVVGFGFGFLVGKSTF